MIVELSIKGGLQLRGKRINGRTVSDTFSDLSSPKNSVRSVTQLVIPQPMMMGCHMRGCSVSAFHKV